MAFMQALYRQLLRPLNIPLKSFRNAEHGSVGVLQSDQDLVTPLQMYWLRASNA